MSSSSIFSFLQKSVGKNFGGAREVALDVERRLVYVIIWPTLIVVYSIQALLAHSPVSSWQILFIISAWILLGLSYYLLRRVSAPFAFSIIAVYLLVLPFIYQEPNTKPWMSYGLIIFVTTFLVVDIQKWYISLPLIGLLTLLERSVINRGFTTINDVRDVRALHGYFSATWVLGFGVCAYWILREYLKRATTLEGNLESHQKEIFSKLRNINKLNRRDYRNIQLHGTVLNTLNGALLDADLLKSPKQLAHMLQADIDSLLLDPLTEREVRRKYNDISTNAPIQVSSKIFPWAISDRRITAQTLELIRELILNTSRHTQADRVSISLKKESAESVLLEFKDNSLGKVATEDIAERISSARSSRTLKRLIQGLNASVSIEASTEGSGILYRIAIPLRPEIINPANILYRVRNSPVSFFTTGLARITIAYSVVCIPGYFLLHVDWRVIALAIISTIASVMSVFLKKFEKLLIFAGTYIGLIGFALAGFLFQSCSVGVYLPWFYNYIIGMVFLTAITGKSFFTQWSPALIFGLESFLLPHLYSADCRDLLNGSTPGLVVIVLCAIATLNWRRRYSEGLAVTASGIYSDSEKLENIQQAIEDQAQWVIAEIARFAKNIESKTFSLAKLPTEIRRQVDLVRAFLLCSEHFESAFVRELFDFTRDRFEDGQTTRMQIYGDHFVHLQDEKGARALFTKLYEGIETNTLEITFQGLDRVSMEVLLDSRTFNKYLKSPLRLPKTPGITVSVERI